MFILCDRWFPGPLAVGIAPCRHLVFVGFFLMDLFCFVFSFALMEPIIALPHVAGLCDRVPTNRNGSVGLRGRRHRPSVFLFVKRKDCIRYL